MRSVPSALTLALVSLLLAGCAAGTASPPVPTGPAADQPVSAVPPWMHPFLMRTAPAQPFVFPAMLPDAHRHHKHHKKIGLYAAQTYGPDLLGYVDPNRRNFEPICRIVASFVNGFTVDNSGNLVVPSGYPAELNVYQGPRACKKLMGKIADPYGQASDAAADDAAKGTIVVGNIEASNTDKVGNIAVCTLAKGCKREVKSPYITYYGGGVALSKKGDCWMTSENNPLFTSATLTYFKHCKGSGQVAQGWKNASYGGLIHDKAGNLISVDYESAAIWIYKGCNPQCQLVGGPFALKGNSLYGNLNEEGNELALGDVTYGQVDVYDYTPTSITYEYSFRRGLVQADYVEAAAFTPTF